MNEHLSLSSTAEEVEAYRLAKTMNDAAPDMYKALKELMEYMDCGMWTEGPTRDHIHYVEGQARNALRRAEGTI